MSNVDVRERLRARVLELAEQVEYLALKDPIAYAPDWHCLTNALHLVRRAWELVGEGYPEEAQVVLELISYPAKRR